MNGDKSMRFPNNCCGELPASGASFETCMCAKKTFGGKPKNKTTKLMLEVVNIILM